MISSTSSAFGFEPNVTHQPEPSHQIAFTLFPDVYAKHASLNQWEWAKLVDMLKTTHKQHASKQACPLIKLARFGDLKTDTGSLRHDSNVIEITGLEGDYDGGQIELGEAQRRLHDAGIEAALYTSPSHRLEKPRWRVLAPLSKPCQPSERVRFLARLNGALGGILGPESFVLSQAYYIGRVNGAPYQSTRTRGQFIDLLPELDARAIRPKPKEGESRSQRREQVHSDPIMQWLGASAMVKRWRSDGGVDIICPFASEHTGQGGNGDTTYFPPHTGGYASGHFHCLHAHCASRTDTEFLEALGWSGEHHTLDSSDTRGDSGDRGDSPHQSRNSTWRQAGDLGRLPDTELKKALESARDRLACESFKASEYPISALGPLADACDAIARGGQMQMAMAGQSLLTTAALLVQSRANVRTLAGIKPVSLYAVTIAASGDGKTTAEEVSLKAVDHWQRQASESYRAELQAAELGAAARKKNDPKPELPRESYLVMRDGTVEGIRRAFKQGLPSQAVFTSEAAMMLAGYGMNADNRAKSASNFNSLWDRGEISVARGLDGRLQLYDRRLSLHWQIQPEVARSALHDPLLANIGFWPRFLVAWPDPGGPRYVRAFRPDQDVMIGAYWKRCTQLLESAQGEDCRDLLVIESTDEAITLFGQFFERMEQARLPDSIMAPVRAFALRATEIAFRIGATLTAWVGKQEIDVQCARDAIALVTYSLDTWLGIFGTRDEDDARQLALGLYGWMLRQEGGRVREATILHTGLPKRIRSKDRRDTALAVLHQHGLVEANRDVWSALIIRTSR
jgi:hypothetical protein